MLAIGAGRSISWPASHRNAVVVVAFGRGFLHPLPLLRHGFCGGIFLLPSTILITILDRSSKKRKSCTRCILRDTTLCDSPTFSWPLQVKCSAQVWEVFHVRTTNVRSLLLWAALLLSPGT